LSPFFPGGVIADRREHVTEWWCEVFDGPTDYTNSRGGYHSMLEHHRNLGISAEQRLRFASLVSLAANDADLPGDPDFRAPLVGYLEWDTQLAMHNSQPKADVVEEALCRSGLGRSASLSALAVSGFDLGGAFCSVYRRGRLEPRGSRRRFLSLGGSGC
jgi:truncated hemoglobin YjbI